MTYSILKQCDFEGTQIIDQNGLTVATLSGTTSEFLQLTLAAPLLLEAAQNAIRSIEELLDSKSLFVSSELGANLDAISASLSRAARSAELGAN